MGVEPSDPRGARNAGCGESGGQIPVLAPSSSAYSGVGPADGHAASRRALDDDGALYEKGSKYVKAVKESAGALVDAGFLLPVAARAIIDGARGAPIARRRNR